MVKVVGVASSEVSLTVYDRRVTFRMNCVYELHSRNKNLLLSSVAYTDREVRAAPKSVTQNY